MSLQLPAYVRRLRQRQAELAEQECWFISEVSASNLPEPGDKKSDDAAPEREKDGTVVVTSDVRTEIKAAIEEQMPPAPVNGTKTSASHPIQ